MKLTSNILAMGALSLVAFAAAGCSNSETADTAPPTHTTIIETAPAAPTKVVVAANPDASTQTSNTNAGPGGATGVASGTADVINTAIVHNTQMTGSRVTAVVDASGVATLNGFVQNAQQKALAEKAAKDTPGVTSLKDKLEIRPTGGAGATVASRVTTLTVGGDSTVAPAPAQPAATPTPRVVVVNNYVPVPQQAPASPPSVNVTVNPPANNGNGNGNGNDNGGQSNGNGNNILPPDGSNPSAYNYITPENSAVMNSRLVPNYLRNMALSRDYELSQYATPYGYGGPQSYPNPNGTYGYPNSYGGNGGYPGGY